MISPIPRLGSVGVRTFSPIPIGLVRDQEVVGQTTEHLELTASPPPSFHASEEDLWIQSYLLRYGDWRHCYVGLEGRVVPNLRFGTTWIPREDL